MNAGIRSHTDGRVMTVVFDRPDKKNAFTVGMYSGLIEALASAERDPQIRAVLLRGEGGCFTSGNDVGDFLQDPPKDLNHPVIRFLHAIASFPKPLVAAVEGPAVGIGTTLLLHCDLVYAAKNSRFRMPFVSMGLVPEGGSSLLIPRMCSPQLAAELLLLGEFFSADKAAQIGIVNEVLEDGEALHARAEDRARALAKLPPEAMRLSKALLRRSTEAELHATLDEEGTRFAQRLGSPEALEALTAFMEKREPKFD